MAGHMNCMSFVSLASTPHFSNITIRRIVSRAFPKSKLARDGLLALIAVGAIAGILVTLCSLCPPRWETNDDVAMSMAAHGYGMAAIGTPDLVFSNVVWGHIVRATPSVLGTVGYSVATTVVLAIIGAALTLGVGLLSGRVLIGISATLLIMVRPVLFPQFTVNAGLLAAAAIVCWRLYNRYRNPIPLVAGCILWLTGFVVRELECVLVLVVGLPIVPWHSFLWSRAGRIATIATIALAGAVTVLDWRAYQTSEWDSFNEFNLARMLFTDYGAAEALRQRPEILKRHGYSLNDVSLLENWFFADPAIAKASELRAMVHEMPLAPTGRNFSNLWAALQTFWHPNLLPLVLVALVLGVLRAGWKVAASWILCCLAVMAMGYVGRPSILRVYIPLVSLLVIAPMIVATDAWAHRQLAMVGAVAAAAWGYIVRATLSVLRAAGNSVAATVVLATIGAALTLGAGLLSGRILIGILAGLPIVVRPVPFLQFTANAGLLAAAAIICWRLYNRYRNPVPLVAGCILLLLTGFVGRELECVLVPAVALPIAPWRSLLRSRAGRIAMIATIALLGILRPSWDVAASWILCCVAVIPMGYVGRSRILRVYAQLVSLLAPGRIAGAHRQLAVIGIVAAGACFGILQTSSQSHKVRTDDKAIRAGLNGFPNEPVVVWGAALPYEALYPVLGKSPVQGFHFYSLASFTYAPFSVSMAEEKAGRGLINRLASQAGLTFVASAPSITLLKVYCQEHLKATLERLEERQYGRLTLQRYRCVPPTKSDLG
jgi:hypothetical protein